MTEIMDFLGCLVLPPNAQFVKGSGKKLGYECVDGYELQDDGSCEDKDECDQPEKVRL